MAPPWFRGKLSHWFVARRAYVFFLQLELKTKKQKKISQRPRKKNRHVLYVSDMPFLLKNKGSSTDVWVRGSGPRLGEKKENKVACRLPQEKQIEKTTRPWTQWQSHVVASGGATLWP
jgi:hypothetical protein